MGGSNEGWRATIKGVKQAAGKGHKQCSWNSWPEGACVSSSVASQLRYCHSVTKNDEQQAVAADPMAIAEATAAAMFANDDASKLIGITIDSVGPGAATVSMTVRPDMTNGLDVCHGGYLFTLADTAMAFASNSRANTAFATAANIDFIAPGRLGAKLVAVATETSLQGRNAIYDVVVSDANDGTVVALFHGRTRDVTR